MSDEANKYCLVTRSDFDGLVSAVLLKHLDLIDDIRFAEPRDVQEGRVQISGKDITSNLPFVADAHLAFDHYLSESLRHENRYENLVIDPQAPSAARVVYEHYGGNDAFPANWDSMMEAVDKGDSAQFTKEEVLYPEGWVLLNFIVDTRSGVEQVGDFRVSGEQLMKDLIDYCGKHGIDEMFALPDVRERSIKYFEHEKPFKAQLLRCAKVRENVIVLDLRTEETIHPGNRFMVYALHPDCNISVLAIPASAPGRTVLAVGKSIFNRTSKTDVAASMLRYGGGGHQNAGACEVGNERVDAVLDELIESLTADG